MCKVFGCVLVHLYGSVLVRVLGFGGVLVHVYGVLVHVYGVLVQVVFGSVCLVVCVLVHAYGVLLHVYGVW